ncbi:MAG: excinuclease ABC subunit UvrC [Verrucomicrobiales bacterium]|nr:excinuclease ABC subunit UvrC [Verrucomicrobiales bacterium]MED5585878.1 excinuclease ABC subunit UvrC [Verrucomicrobiota bacterium]
MSTEYQREPVDFPAKLRDVPHKPGVYLMRDRLNRVIYVGKARDLRKRLASYFTPTRRMRSDLKTRALIESIRDFDTHVLRSEHEALLLEVKLIKEYRPKYNVSFRDDKRFLLLKVRESDALPRFQLVRVRKDDGGRYFGPFAHSGALRATLHWVNRRFGLRTCRPRVPGESDYRHCHDDVIANCSAPCVGKVSREEYLKRMESACEFLDGGWRNHVTEMEEDMDEAVARQDFEQAAQLRDMIESFRKTLQSSRRFTRGRGLPGNGSGIDPLADVEQLRDVLGLASAPMVMECFDISNISSSHIVASMVRFKGGVPDNASYRRYRIKGVKEQDDFASMAEVVRRRYSRILLEEKGNENNDGQADRKRPYVCLPDLVIVDGGKGQLSSALRELRQLGLGELPVIGLAKQNEEIFRPGATAPLTLPHDTGALRLLQRIRDEAHRFANGYHQLLMKRRIGESILDDCPGVSDARKAALLREFGSVARLKRVSAEEIAGIRGISLKAARSILDFLHNGQDPGGA